MRDYTRKTVYIGIDVHKKTYAVTAICENEVVKRDTLVAYPQQLLMTALHWAIKRDHVECARVLLELGASPDIENAQGITAKAMMQESANGEMEELLVQFVGSPAVV